MDQTFLGIDWGTSNRRAYHMARDGRCLAQHDDDQGLLAVAGNFAASLAQLRATMGIDAAVPVIMSGMVGSNSGWQEVPYLDIAVPLEQLPQHLAAVGGNPACLIVPGYCARNDGVDVMRGEETQLLGAIALGIRDGWMVLPGTHSKWVYLRDGVVQQLSTYMTGELFAMLSKSGTLAPMMATVHNSATNNAVEHNVVPSTTADDDLAFAAGMAEARECKPLTHSLFGVRARVVAKAMAAGAARSFVSGLLIGTEFVAAQARDGNVIHLIASATLSARYARAAAQFGMQAVVLDPDAVFRAALGLFFPKDAG